MLSVGIHENVTLLQPVIKMSKKDEPILCLTFTQADPDASEVVADESGLNDFNSADVTSAAGGNSTIINLFGATITIPGYPANSPEQVKKKITWQKDVLTQILEGYMPKSKITWDLFRGFTFTADAAATKATIARIMTVQSEVNKVINNLNAQFIDHMKAVSTAELGAEFRVKFTRTSKAKDYPAIPNFGIFFEPMIIPAASSKVKFSDWEIKEGFNLSIKVTAEPNTAVSADAVVNEAFGTL